MPGTKEEMDHFEQHTVSRSRCAVTCTIPSLRVHLPSKEFLEILFSRYVCVWVCGCVGVGVYVCVCMCV